MSESEGSAESAETDVTRPDMKSENEELDQITAEAVGLSVAVSGELQDVLDPLPVGGLWIHASRRTLHVGGEAAGKGPLVLACSRRGLGDAYLKLDGWPASASGKCTTCFGYVDNKPK